MSTPQDYFNIDTNNPLLDSLGRLRTRSLFWEHRRGDYPYFWTLRDEDTTKDGKVVPSLFKIYMSYDHIPFYEYEFAVDQFRSWDHWMAIANESSLKDYVESWREKLNIRNRCIQIRNLASAARTGDVSASKYLAEGKYDMAQPKRGRPTKEEKAGHLKKIAEEAAATAEISDRVASLLERKKG